MFASRINSAGTINNAWPEIGPLQVESGSGNTFACKLPEGFNLILILEYG